MKHDDFATEPIPGLPERLPAGETILWQGAPDWKALALRVFHARKVAIYFALLAVWRFIANLNGGETVMTALGAATLMLAIGASAVGLFTLFAWLTERTTVYTITNKRLVMRFGIALPMAINLPFRSIKSASLKLRADGTGDIPLALVDNQRIAYLILWPHARPWRLGKPEPSLRSIPDAESVAEKLSDALAASLAASIDERSSAAAAKQPRSKPSDMTPGKSKDQPDESLQPADAVA